MVSARRPDQKKYEVDFVQLHLSVRWNTFLLPFEQSKFISRLPDEGYVLDGRVRQTVLGSPFQEASGTLARKGTTSLVMEMSTPTLGLNAENGQTLVEEFDLIEETLRKNLSFDSPQHASFYEVLASALVWTKQDALQVLRRLGSVQDITSRFAERTGMGPASNVAMRFVPAKGEMHSADWWDVHIEPSFRSPHQCYRVTVVYRHPERSEVIQVAENIVKVIEHSIESLEASNE
jgi:hypothetical protein